MLVSCVSSEAPPVAKVTIQPGPTVFSSTESQPTPEPDINSTSNHPCPLVTNEKNNQNLREEPIQLKQDNKILTIEPIGICSHPVRDEIYILEKGKIWVTSTETQEVKPFSKELPEYADALRYCIADTKDNIFLKNVGKSISEVKFFQFNAKKIFLNLWKIVWREFGQGPF